VHNISITGTPIFGPSGAATFYVPLASFFSASMVGGLAPNSCQANNYAQRKKSLKNPTSLSRNGVSKSPYHILPPSKGIGERISEGDDNKMGGKVNKQKLKSQGDEPTFHFFLSAKHDNVF
jgi:hypothetical protein